MPEPERWRQSIVGCATMTGMKRSTAVGPLGEVAEALDRMKQWPGVSVTAAYVHGALTDGADDLEYVEIAVVVDDLLIGATP